MGIEINKENLTIEIKDSFSWENNAQYVFDRIYEDLKYDVENHAEDLEEEELENSKKFLAYELTNEDKLELLEAIKENYEYQLYRDEFSASLFDEDVISDKILEWVKDNFNVEI